MSQGAPKRRKHNVRFTGISNSESVTGEGHPTDPLVEDATGDTPTVSANITDPEIPNEPLEQDIRKYIIESSEKGREFEFLPRDDLEKLVTEERITQALARAGCDAFQAQTEITNAHPNSTEIQNLMNSDELAKRKEIFAILILMGNPKAVLDFINGRIDDTDLPFELERGEGMSRKTLKRRDPDGKLEAIDLFSTWQSKDLEAFEAQQWKIHVPVFNTIENKGKPPPHWNLATKTVLPYLESTFIGKGGFSDVNKVRLHTSHHDGAKDMVKCYAVKRLRDSNEDAFQEEVSNLRRFSDKDHPHLIRLLWTFSRGPDFHLVFPCARGNLMDLWKEYSLPLAAERDPDKALWVARQCLGIIEGLQMIHLDDAHASSSKGTNKPHGRHGDLKPENILWFEKSDTQNGYRLGVLTISDFGLADFHGTDSRSRINLRLGRVGVSYTYRAPEYDVRDEIAQNYDIWSLACVLLQLLMWYLKGWEEVDKFSKIRAEERDNPTLPGYQEDAFFNYLSIRGRDGSPQAAAQAKPSVAKAFRELSEHENASDFSNDLLDFIEEKLLRMNPKSRASCTEVLNTFQRLYNNCEADKDYCLQRVKKRPKRSATDLSILKPVAVDLPRDVESRITRQTLPAESPSPRIIPPRRGSGSSITRKSLCVPEDPIQEESDVSDSGVEASRESSSRPGENRGVDDGDDGLTDVLGVEY